MKVARALAACPAVEIGEPDPVVAVLGRQIGRPGYVVVVPLSPPGRIGLEAGIDQQVGPEIAHHRIAVVVVAHHHVTELVVGGYRPVVGAVVIGIEKRGRDPVGTHQVTDIRSRQRCPLPRAGAAAFKTRRISRAFGGIVVGDVVHREARTAVGIGDIHVHLGIGVRTAAGKTAAHVVGAESQAEGSAGADIGQIGISEIEIGVGGIVAGTVGSSAHTYLQRRGAADGDIIKVGPVAAGDVVPDPDDRSHVDHAAGRRSCDYAESLPIGGQRAAYIDLVLSTYVGAARVLEFQLDVIVDYAVVGIPAGTHGHHVDGAVGPVAIPIISALPVFLRVDCSGPALPVAGTVADAVAVGDPSGRIGLEAGIADHILPRNARRRRIVVHHGERHGRTIFQNRGVGHCRRVRTDHAHAGGVYPQNHHG